MKASDKFWYHWKECHFYSSGKLISSHCELYRIGKSFLENLLRIEILKQWNISDFQLFCWEFKITVIILLLGLNHLPYLLHTYINLKIPKFFLCFWGANVLYPYLWLLFWSFYGGGYSLHFLRIFWKIEKYFDQKNYTIFIDSLEGISGRKMRIGIEPPSGFQHTIYITSFNTLIFFRRVILFGYNI